MISLNICYDKLWIMLINKKMSKQDLRKATGISSATFTKLNHDIPVTAEILIRICEVLECDIGDICSVVPSDKQSFSDSHSVNKNTSN